MLCRLTALISCVLFSAGLLHAPAKPLNRAHDIQAKSILIEVGGEDGTVDKGQGAQFWNDLKGEPAPAWIAEGQSWLQRKAVLDANK
jgi:hypothetical protein